MDLCHELAGENGTSCHFLLESSFFAGSTLSKRILHRLLPILERLGTPLCGVPPALNAELISTHTFLLGGTTLPGSWKPLASQPPFPADTMLLLTDGTVFCHEFESKNWYRLIPDSAGDYDTAGAQWKPAAPLPDNPIIPANKGGPTNAPLYFASAVLRDGSVFVAGGEYNSGIADADLLA